LRSAAAPCAAASAWARRPRRASALHEAELGQRRRAAAAQQAATVAALRSLGLGNPAALAAMNPVLARALISRGERR
jgi:hypothetical protein